MEVQPAIQCDLQATVTLLTNFPAKIDPFPITYLGIPLGIKKLKKIDMQPLIDKVAKRLPSWKANLLNKAGRTVLIKSTLSAIPTHTVVPIKISPWAIQCIDKIRKGFLWSGAVSAKNGHCLLAWPRVCRPPDLGGLRILDLNRFGFALRMKWLWLRRTDPSRPWLHLSDDREPVVDAMFRASIYLELGDGATALFWSDRWLQGVSL